MTPFVIAFLVFALAGLGLTLWLRSKPASPVSAGQAAERSAAQLSKLRWRDFAKLVLQAMHKRGYKPAYNSEHLEGSSLDMLPPEGKTMLWLKAQVRKYDPNAKLLIHDGHLHASFPGYWGAPPLGGAKSAGLHNPNAGMAAPPPGYRLQE